MLRSSVNVDLARCGASIMNRGQISYEVRIFKRDNFIRYLLSQRTYLSKLILAVTIIDCVTNIETRLVEISTVGIEKI